MRAVLNATFDLDAASPPWLTQLPAWDGNPPSIHVEFADYQGRLLFGIRTTGGRPLAALIAELQEAERWLLAGGPRESS